MQINIFPRIFSKKERSKKEKKLKFFKSKKKSEKEGLKKKERVRKEIKQTKGSNIFLKKNGKKKKD